MEASVLQQFIDKYKDRILYIEIDNAGKIYFDKIVEGTFSIDSSTDTFQYQDNGRNKLIYIIPCECVQRIILMQEGDTFKDISSYSLAL
jgi:hypothetical protein